MDRELGQAAQHHETSPDKQAEAKSAEGRGNAGERRNYVPLGLSLQSDTLTPVFRRLSSLPRIRRTLTVGWAKSYDSRNRAHDQGKQETQANHGALSLLACCVTGRSCVLPKTQNGQTILGMILLLLPPSASSDRPPAPLQPRELSSCRLSSCVCKVQGMLQVTAVSDGFGL